MELLIVFIFSILMSIMTYKKRLLSFWGSCSIMIMLFLIDLFGKWQMVFLISWAYLTLSVIDKIFSKKIEKSVSGIHEKSGARSAYQVWVNGGMAILMIILYGITNDISFLIGYIVAIGESYADSLASDVGVMSHSCPIDICSFKRINNGLSGGVSFLGTFSSLIGVIIYSTIAFFLIKLTISQAILIVFMSFFGCILDSVIGSKMQVKYKCEKCDILTEKKEHCNLETKFYSGIPWLNNSKVNLITNIITGIVSVILFKIIY